VYRGGARKLEALQIVGTLNAPQDSAAGAFHLIQFIQVAALCNYFRTFAHNNKRSEEKGKPNYNA